MTTDRISYAHRAAERYRQDIEHLASNLRELAAEVERRGVARDNLRTLRPDHTTSAQRVIHAVAWGIANLHLDGLIDSAAEADRASAPKVELDPDQQRAARAVAEYLDVQATLRYADHEELHSIGKHGLEYKLRASDLRTLLDVFTNAEGKA